MGTIVVGLSSIIVSYYLAKTAPLLILKAWAGVVRLYFRKFTLSTV